MATLVRVNDRQRDSTVERLKRMYQQGYLEAEEYESRTALALQSMYESQLQALTSDLPATKDLPVADDLADWKKPVEPTSSSSCTFGDYCAVAWVFAVPAIILCLIVFGVFRYIQQDLADKNDAAAIADMRYVTNEAGNILMSAGYHQFRGDAGARKLTARINRARDKANLEDNYMVDGHLKYKAQHIDYAANLADVDKGHTAIVPTTKPNVYQVATRSDTNRVFSNNVSENGVADN